MNKKKTFFKRAGLIIAGLTIIQYWLMGIMGLQQGLLFTHKNYWNAPVGTYNLVAVLIVATPIWLWAIWKYWR